MMALDHERMRHAMVASQLRPAGVFDPRVIAAMAAVAREDFVGEANAGIAYRDTPLPLAGGREQNVPLATGRLLDAAGFTGSERVLLIGAAGGYTAALLSRLVREVVAVEPDAVLAEAARTALAACANVRLVEGTLEAGDAGGAPYDVIVIDGAVPALPEGVLAQLRIGGRVVAGVADRGVTRLATGVRTEGGFALEPFADIECVVLPVPVARAAFRF